ncbi:MAG: radical SAM protein [Clostridia bacterium]|nr:radical SAM protein [Clostridia bacterium]
MEKLLISRAAQYRRPLSGTIELTPLCNMSCEMCYVRLNREELHSHGNLHTANEWISLAKEMAHAGVLFLLLTGGEPLLFPEFEKLYLAMKNLGMIITINTNGTLIDERWAEFFSKHQPRRVNVTIYGKDEDTYGALSHHRAGYLQAVRGIRLLKEAGVSVKINGSITNANVGDMDAIYALGHELNCPVHMDTYMVPCFREGSRQFDSTVRMSPEKAAEARVRSCKAEMSRDDFESFAKSLISIVGKGNLRYGTHMTCQAGKSSFAINWKGEMKPCITSVEPSVSVFDTSFELAWRQISAHVKQMHIHERCATCRLRPLCDICVVNAYWETGSYDGVPEYLCRYANETMRVMAAILRREMQRKEEV